MPQSTPAFRIQENLAELFQGKKASGDAYIKFQLTPEIQALLPMQQVQQSSIIKAGQITPLAGMPESSIGMINSRDRVFCVFDLAQLLTLPMQLVIPRQYQIIVVQTTIEPQIQIGLAVKNLQGIIRVTSEQIKPFNDEIEPRLIPFISGVVIQQKTVLTILNLQRILEALQTETVLV